MSYPDVFDAVNETLEHPQDYYGDIIDLQDQGWGCTFGRHRDSDNLDISNYEQILQAFHEKFELNEDFRVEGSRHWAVGWTDQILVRALQCDCEDWEEADITVHPDAKSKGLKLWRCHTCATDFGIERVRPIFYEALEFKSRLDDYPILDEEHYSKLEHEELLEWLEQEVSAFVRHEEGETIEEDWEPDLDKVFEYLFDIHSVSTVEDCNVDWIGDAVLAIADKEGKKL
jgi:hypothetical protein